MLALAHPNPWSSASFYLPSQSLADSRCNPHATSRSSHSRRSPSCRFLLCRVALFCLVLRRRHAAHHRDFKERSVVLAVAHPWASASFYLSSQSLADSRCNLHATSRSSHSRRSPSCRFLLCRVALVCLVLRRRRRLPLPCSRGFSRLSAQLCPPRGIFWPLEFIEVQSCGWSANLHISTNCWERTPYGPTLQRQKCWGL